MFYFSDYTVPRNISCKRRSKMENYLQMKFLKYFKFSRKELYSFWSLGDINSSGTKDEKN